MLSKGTRAKLNVFVTLVLCIAAFLTLYKTFFQKTQPAILLAQTDGLIQVATILDAKRYTKTSISLPTNLLGSTVQIIGIYQKDTPFFPADSFSVVLTKKQWRFADLSFLNNRTIEEQRALYHAYPQEDFMLAQGVPAVFVRMPIFFDRCIPPVGAAPGACVIGHAIMFEQNNNTILISGDREHITEGELMMLARGMLAAKSD